MLNIFIGALPIIFVSYFLYYIKNYKSNNILVILVFLSYIVFATNYKNYGLDFDLFRYIHKFIGILIIFSLVYHIYKNGLKILYNPVFILILLFFFIILLSYIGNDIYMPHYIHYARNFIFISTVVLFLYFKIETKQNLDEVLNFIVNLTLFLAIFVLIEFFIPSNTTRAFLFYPNPNYLGISLMFGFSILLFKESKLKILKVILLIIGIYLTGSRAIEIGLVLLLLLFLFKNKESIKLKYLIFFGLVLIIFFTIFKDKILLNQDNRGTRTGIVKISLNILNEHLINGLGYGQFRSKYFKYIDDEIKKMDIQEIRNKIKDQKELMTHNDLLKIVTELGLFGLAFIIFYFYKLYIELKKLFIANKDYFYISLSLLIGSLTFSLFHNNITSFVFWFVLFLPFIINKIYLYEENRI